jgi:hypothetical protein
MRLKKSGPSSRFLAVNGTVSSNRGWVPDRVKGNIMSTTQFGLTLLYIAVAVFFYAAGWWQGKTVERDRWEERAAAQNEVAAQDVVAAQDQLVQQGQAPGVPVPRQPIRAHSPYDSGPWSTASLAP